MRPECIKFLCDILGWRDEKVNGLNAFKMMGTVEEYLDAFSKDNIGLRNHSFVSDNYSCKICEDPESEHHEFSCCVVCFRTAPLIEFLTMKNCNHTYCRVCWAQNINAMLQEGKL